MPQNAAPRELLMSVAQDMIVKGWQPVWCLARQGGAFTPIPGTTGGTSPFPTVEPQPQGSHRLAFRPPPEVTVFDVDHYDAKRGADTIDKAEAWLGPLPPTWKVTSRGDENPSGRYLYRKPAGLDFGDSALAQFCDEQGHTCVEIVRTGHRFSWAPGDTNHKNGLRVECFDPLGEPCLLPPVEDLPELPPRWIAYLRNPPVPQVRDAYTRPADGPLWWLGQADGSLGSDAELAAFAFQMLLSRVPLDEIFTQWLRVSRAVDPSWQWSRADFDRHVRDQAQGKAAAAIAREDAEERVFEGIAGGPENLKGIADQAQAEYRNKQLLSAALEPQVPFDAALYQQITQASGIMPPDSGDKTAPLGHIIRKLPEYDRLLWQELAKGQARKDAAAIQAGQFTGYSPIADLPEPPEPETLIITGKDQKNTRVIGKGTVTVVSGQRSSGKTWAVAAWAAQELRAGNKIIWLDFERQDMLLNSKLRSLGIQRHTMIEQLQYTPVLPPPERLARDIEAASRYGAFRVLLVIDAFRTLQGLVAPGTSANDGDAVEQVYIEYLTPAVEAGANVILLDHMPKGGTTTFGSERKESAADYVIRVDKVQPFSKKTQGYSCLTIMKDRYGNFDDGTALGYLWMPGDGSGSAAEGITKYPPVPELRNWAPDGGGIGLEDTRGKSGKSQKEDAVIAIVRDNRLQLGPRPLGDRVAEVYPDLFTSAKAATDFARRMGQEGKLLKEEGRDGKYDLPGAALEVHEPQLDPRVLEPEEITGSPAVLHPAQAIGQGRPS